MIAANDQVNSGGTDTARTPEPTRPAGDHDHDRGDDRGLGADRQRDDPIMVPAIVNAIQGITRNE